MELGEKLRFARQEAGLSQRQLCGDVITRNMLSQIEHGTAKPSMETLRHLASKLQKPVSYFLEEDAVVSPNQELMARARASWEARESGEVWLMLKQFRQPDPVLQWEWEYLSFAAALESAKKAMAEEKHLYARQLLEEAAAFAHGIPALERQRLLRLGQIPGADPVEIVGKLPSLDEELLLRAEAALAERNTDRAAALLEAAENRDNGTWNLLRGRTLMEQKWYTPAAVCLQKAEAEFPADCVPLLEICFRELNDFKRAYEYACKRR